MKRIITTILIMAFGLIWHSCADFNLSVDFSYFSDLYKRKISIINFYNWSWSNIQNAYWFLIVKGVDYITGENIWLGNESINCYGKLRWYYVNLARWNYLLPLSSKDNASFINLLNWDNNIYVTWWFYTACNWSNMENNSIIGYIGYEIDGVDYFDLHAWFKYNVYENKIVFSGWFVNNFKLVNWVFPVWFIYDKVGWVWFVWADVSSKEIAQVNEWANQSNLNITITGDSLKIGSGDIVGEIPDFNIIVASLVWVQWLYNISDWSFNTSEEKKLYLKQLSVNTVDNESYWWKAIAYNANLMSFSKIHNIVRKNAENICRGKVWNVIYGNTTFSELDKVNCFKWSGSITINYDPTYENNQVVIVSKWVDIIVNTSMEWKWYVEMYIDKARLLIDNNINLISIGKDWHPNDNWVTSWAVIKWLFVVNWLLWWYDENIGYTWFKHKLYVLWQFTSLNTISNPKDERINFVKDILWWDITKQDINLLNVFNWRCLETGVWTDGINCSNSEDKWSERSVIFINKKYSFKLLK